LLKILKKIFLYLLLIYAVLGFFVLPFIVKPKIIEIVAQETNAKVEIGGVYINPFLFKVAISDVVLFNLKDEKLVSFKKLFLDLELYSVARQALHVHELSLVEPKVSLVYNKDKTFNILNIIKVKEELDQEENSSLELPRIIVDEVSIKNGEVQYKDFTLKTPFYFSFNTIGFDLKEVDTDESGGSQAHLRLYTTLGDGGFVDFKSNLKSLKDFKADGSLDFEASKLYTEWKYVQDILNLEVADGKISFHGEYDFALNDINATKIDKLDLSVEKLRIKPKSKPKDVLNIEMLSVENATIFPLQQSVEIDKVALDGLKVAVKCDKSAAIDWIDYIKVNQDLNTSQKESKKDDNNSIEAKPWNLLLKDLSLQRIALGFEDSTVSPMVSTNVNELNVYAKNITLLGEEAFSYKMDMQLNETGKCKSEGSIAHKELEIKSFLACQGLNVVHYNSYIESEAKKALKLYKLKLQSAILNFNVNTHLKQSGESVEVLVSDANIALNKFNLSKQGKRKSIFGFTNFLLNDIDVDTADKSVKIGKVTFNKLYTNLEKYKDGSLNLENLVEARKAEKTKTKSDSNPFSVELKHFALNGGSVKFKDSSLENIATNKISNIYANAYDIDLKKYSWLTYNLRMKVNQKGTLKAEGKLRHTPLMQSGSFDIRDISLVALTPYLQESAYVSVDDGKLSLKGKTSYHQNSSDADLKVDGSLLLRSFFVNDTLNNTQLFTLGELDVKSYTFELNPSRLFIDEVDVNAFYVDASVDKNKTINFSKLMKTDAKTQSEDQNKTREEQSSPFPYRISRVNVALGSAKFADYSIPLKFSTHIHDLGGTIYSISNSVGDTTYVDMAGEIDKYASTRLKGSIDSANPKAYTDLDFNFKNLDLNSFSGYSANFAGHEIDSGKLYLDLGYDIQNSQLEGSNSIIIKQIKLGREIDDENVSVLPLGFVIGLLEDSDGIIDIDMPVKGDLDEPDFKYGALVFKTLGNLIAKAAISPFKFLGAAMGINGEELAFVAFEAGSSDISPPQREKLDTIVGLMLKKPKIILGVAGSYEIKKDKEAMQLAKLKDLVVKKSGIKNIEDNENAMNTDMLEEIYDESKDNDVLSKTREELHKLHEDDATYERVYNNRLVILCRDIQVVSENELVELAKQRADKIIGYLVEEKMLEASRIDKKPTVVTQENDEHFVKVDMEIEVK